MSTAPNAELAYRVLDLTAAHPERFDMEQWADGVNISTVGIEDLIEGDACGTTACFAGWTAALCGYKLGMHADVYDKDGRRVSYDIQSFAANLLGITQAESEDLFFVADADIADAVADTFGPRLGGAE